MWMWMSTTFEEPTEVRRAPLGPLELAYYRGLCAAATMWVL